MHRFPCSGFLIFISLLGFFPIAKSSITNFLSLNLLETNTSSIEKELENQLPPLIWSASLCLEPQLDCPAIMKLSWQSMPPFMSEKPAQNETRAGQETTGIFKDILHHAFRICCHPCPTTLQYSEGGNSTSTLHRELFTKKATGIFPVHSNDPLLYGGELPYVHVLTSPGFMLIVNKEDFKENGRLAVWNALAGTWPVLAPSILLVVIAGICVWALEYHSNQGEFPREFFKGAANGVWWSFVSMTTVGYGDKSPRTLFGRIFGMVWIIFGLVVCSFMVATLQCALTVTSMDKKIEIFGKNISVLEGSQSYMEAVYQGARVKVHPSFEDAYDYLVNKHEVYGILEEIPFGIAHLSEVKDDRLVIARLFMREISYGIALDKKFPFLPYHCLGQLFKFRVKDVAVILERYYYMVMDVKRKVIVHGEEHEAVISLLDDRSPFYSLLLYVLLILLGIMLVGGLVHQLAASRDHCRGQKEPEKKVSSVIPLANLSLEDEQRHF